MGVPLDKPLRFGLRSVFNIKAVAKDSLYIHLANLMPILTFLA